MPFLTIRVENPDSLSLILGRLEHHRGVDRIHKAIVAKNPDIRFGVAALEASHGEMVLKGTDKNLIGLASSSLHILGVTSTFVLFTEKKVLPKFVMQTIRVVSSIKAIYCATSSAIEVLIRENDSGRDVIGLVDDYASSDQSSITQTSPVSPNRVLPEWLPNWAKRTFFPSLNKEDALQN